MSDAPLSFGLIIIGDEILSGKRADKHLPKVIELLQARGLELAHADYVGDDPARITATLARAFTSGEVVFSCGGSVQRAPWASSWPCTRRPRP
jgi:molybdopterin-biosynthesis enzyme MoeA-like protein